MTLRSGETQLWRIANVGADLYYDVELAGHRLHVIAEDGSPVWRVRANATWCWHRASATTCSSGAPPGRSAYDLRTRKFDEGFQLLPRTKLATVRVRGPASRSRAEVPRTLETPGQEPGQGSPVAAEAHVHILLIDNSRRRTSLRNQRPGLFDPDATRPSPPWSAGRGVDAAQDVTSEDHPFHIHVNDFQVMRVNRKPYHARGACRTWSSFPSTASLS